jgi:hypothetical protein
MGKTVRDGFLLATGHVEPQRLRIRHDVQWRALMGVESETEKGDRQDHSPSTLARTDISANPGTEPHSARPIAYKLGNLLVLSFDQTCWS